MAARYSIHLHNHQGERIAEIDAFEQLQYTLKQNEVSGLVLVVQDSLYAASLFKMDYTLRVYRQVQGLASLEGQTAYFVRKVRITKPGQITVEAFSLLHLLSRRIVAYSAGTPYADKSGAADDVIKEIVRENLGADAVDTDRSLVQYLTIQEDSSKAPTISKAFSRRNVLEVVQDIAAASTEAGTWLGFDIVIRGSLYYFQTYTGQRGIDRRFNSTNSTLFPMTNLADDTYQEDDYTEEVTYVYALGRGEEEEREVEVAFDLSRLQASPFNRIEAGHQATQAETEAALLDEAATRLQEGQPAFRFSGNLQQVIGSEYGLDYMMGDLLTFEYKGRQFDSRVIGIGVQASVIAEQITTTLGSV